MINALTREGELESSFWAGPEKISQRMLKGDVPVQNGPRQNVMHLHLDFANEDFDYTIALNLPKPSNSTFSLNPKIKLRIS